jgi:hypothetical protein
VQSLPSQVIDFQAPESSGSHNLAMRWTRSPERTVRAGALIAPLFALASACGTGPGTAEMVGQVTTLKPQFCVGRADAQGECFDARLRLLSGIRAGECVTATYRNHRTTPSGRYPLTAVSQANAADHSSDCPG